MIFCIFSFNRGQFLENAVRSVEACVDKPEICVFDDASDDPQTRTILTGIGQRHTVCTPAGGAESKHGGLYGNMQSALARFADAPLVCFLQDDTQLVRRISHAELAQIGSFFDSHPDTGFLHPCFLRGITRTRDQASIVYNADSHTYFRQDAGQSAGVHYSDIFITRPQRLLAKGWRFANSEPNNNRQARQLFGLLPYMATPFIMWLPQVPAYRGKKKTLAMSLAEKKQHCGFYPYRLLPDRDVEALTNRPPSRLPFAEDFLDCLPSSPQKPWTYNPLRKLPWLKKLNAIELFLRKAFT